MTRNLATNECPNCDQVFTLEDALGKPLEAALYGDYPPRLGVKVTSKCNIDLFLWLKGPSSPGMLAGTDLSYYHTFDDDCEPALGYVPVKPQPEKFLRGEELEERNQRYSETTYKEEPWTEDEYDFEIGFDTQKNVYVKSATCNDFKGCEDCLSHGDPINGDVAVVGSNAVKYLREMDDAIALPFIDFMYSHKFSEKCYEKHPLSLILGNLIVKKIYGSETYYGVNTECGEFIPLSHPRSNLELISEEDVVVESSQG